MKGPNRLLRCRLLLCCCAALLLCACGGSNLDTLSGKWVVDSEATMRDMTEGSLLKDSMAVDLFAGILGGISLEINAEKKSIVYTMGMMRLDGTFTVLSDKGTSLVIDESRIGKMRFEHISADSFVMYPDEEKEKKFVFKRAS